MIGRIPRWFLMVGIVTAVSGCDNVSWGGMSVSLQGPPGDSSATQDGTGPEADSGPQYIEYGPLLYAGVRDGDSALVVPVGELVDGSLRPFPAGERGNQLATQIMEERLVPGKELTLFHGGTRIGTMTVSASLGINSEYCSPRPQATGHIEVVPSANSAPRFLALEEELGRHRALAPFTTAVAERAQRNAAQNLAGEALNQLRAPWPAALQNIRQDLQMFQLTSDQGPSLVASFLYQDQMVVGPAPDDAYSLLILGEPQGTRFNRTYTWFRRAGEEGKGAPRFFSHLDWDQDGQDEILLEVLGTDSRWWAALKRDGGGWTVAVQDPCGVQGQVEETAQGSQGGAR